MKSGRRSARFPARQVQGVASRHAPRCRRAAECQRARCSTSAMRSAVAAGTAVGSACHLSQQRAHARRSDIQLLLDAAPSVPMPTFTPAASDAGRCRGQLHVRGRVVRHRHAVMGGQGDFFVVQVHHMRRHQARRQQASAASARSAAHLVLAQAAVGFRPGFRGCGGESANPAARPG